MGLQGAEGVCAAVNSDKRETLLQAPGLVPLWAFLHRPWRSSGRGLK